MWTTALEYNVHKAKGIQKTQFQVSGWTGKDVLTPLSETCTPVLQVPRRGAFLLHVPTSKGRTGRRDWNKVREYVCVGGVFSLGQKCVFPA